jgi:hypothetical protein
MKISKNSAPQITKGYLLHPEYVIELITWRATLENTLKNARHQIKS